jgi:hypothetical protein
MPMTAPSPTEPTQRKRNDAELLAISYRAYTEAANAFEEAPGIVTATALRVWARLLKADQIAANAMLVPPFAIERAIDDTEFWTDRP